MVREGGRLDTRIVEVALPNGATALVRAVDVEGIGATKTGFKDKFDFDNVAATLEGLSDSLKSSLAKAAPDKVTVELGIELALKSGMLTALIVDGEANGALTVTLEWEHGNSAPS
jgi:hypothetical protein